MIILDTCALIFDALTPEKLTTAAKRAISNGEKNSQLFCSDISLWEIAMLIQKKRIDPATDAQHFLRLITEARGIQILSITIEIAVLSTSFPGWSHFDPADRIIAATAIEHQAKLVTCDQQLQNVPDLSIIW